MSLHLDAIQHPWILPPKTDRSVIDHGSGSGCHRQFCVSAKHSRVPTNDDETLTARPVRSFSRSSSIFAIAVLFNMASKSCESYSVHGVMRHSPVWRHAPQKMAPKRHLEVGIKVDFTGNFVLVRPLLAPLASLASLLGKSALFPARSHRPRLRSGCAGEHYCPSVKAVKRFLGQPYILCRSVRARGYSMPGTVIRCEDNSWLAQNPCDYQLGQTHSRKPTRSAKCSTLQR
jgi:hypothetical protein